LARQDTADHGQTQVGSVLGTIDFMPPEQRRGATETDARSDLWSLAATLYQMVSGKSPKIIKFNNVPQALQDVLGKALEDEKDDRYPSGSTTDPTGAASGSDRVFRGGSAADVSACGRSAIRHGNTPDYRYPALGFRVLRRTWKPYLVVRGSD
jgi:serine/threonine protein kinase